MKYLLVFYSLFATITYGQQTAYVDFKHIQADINFNLLQKEVFGKLKCTFKILKDVDSVYLDAVSFGVKDFQISKEHKNSKFIKRGKIAGNYDNNKIWLKSSFKKGQQYTVNFSFSKVNPKKALYFIDWDNKQGNKQIWTQGQGKYTSNWLPSIDDMNDKIKFDLSIIFNSNYQVVSNGKLVKKENYLGKTKWIFNMVKPMSSYLVALVIGKYHKKTIYSQSGIPLEFYFYPKDSLKYEPTYRYSKQIFDFLETEIGVPYPWQNYKQVPVKDFLYAGMENTGATIFSDSFVVDSIGFADKNYVNINAHELAHQWFGNLVTATSGVHHWLQEGFATYYALLAERSVFGDAYYHWRLYEYAQELQQQDIAGRSTALLNPNSSSTTFYKKGAWVLHLLREQVGDKAFKEGVKKYLEKYKFKNVKTEYFINELESVSGKNLSDFVKVWLESPELNYSYLETNCLSFSSAYKAFLDLKNCDTNVSKCFDFMALTNNEYMRANVITRFNDNFPDTIFNFTSIKERQSIAQGMSKIPVKFKKDFESLLNDASYTTIEIALFKLWLNFPNERKIYLKETKGIQGFNDKNVRLLWLTLQLLSKDLDSAVGQEYYNELVSFTGTKYNYEIRQKAFQYLNKIQGCNALCQENLKLATKHHNWRFVKFAKDMLKRSVN